ncbi:tetratricopeptide repeat protein [Stackebrandtia albiflava]|uniref:Tetratricopeptide repeat protein n=1 Tax=Stackebrandtia albiflava TaxID=406432 RepID=A0A562V1G0_9ACTN|nr:tetratricopeptide repeat protein [Stackebrandtia albiflava]TWJ11691.1 tetratricopeptide repeat protein [Stackebrandtia albiflava]
MSFDTSRGLAKAELLLDVGRTTDAIAELVKTIAGDPENATAWYLLAGAHLRAENDATALTAAETAVRLSPESAPYLLRHARILGRLDRYHDAVEVTHAAIRLDPANGAAFELLAALLAQLQDMLPAARDAADEAVRLAPTQAGFRLTQGLVAGAQDRMADAEAAYSEGLRLDPQSAPLHRELAVVRLHRGGLRGRLAALAGFATAVRIDPGDASAAHRVRLITFLLVSWTWRLALGTALLGLLCSVVLFTHMLGDVGRFHHWWHLPVAVVVAVGVAIPAVLHVRAFRQVVPGSLWGGIARTGLRPWQTRLRLAGVAATVLLGVAAPTVAAFPLAAVGLPLLLVSFMVSSFRLDRL